MTTAKPDTPPVDLAVETWREIRDVKHELRNVEQKIDGAGHGILLALKQMGEVHDFVVLHRATVEEFKSLPRDVRDIRASLVEKATQDRAGIPPKHMLLIIFVIGLAVLIQPIRDLVVALAQNQIAVEGEGYGVKGKIQGGKP